MKTMIEIIRDGIRDTLSNIKAPKYRVATKTIEITDIKPYDIKSFMDEENIPKSAWFDSKEDAYDSFSYGTYLSWEVEILATKEFKLKIVKYKFETTVLSHVYNRLISNGYKRKGFNSSFLREFDNTTVFDMYINKQWSRLEKYYSLSFEVK